MPYTQFVPAVLLSVNDILITHGSVLSRITQIQHDDNTNQIHVEYLSGLSSKDCFDVSADQVVEIIAMPKLEQTITAMTDRVWIDKSKYSR